MFLAKHPELVGTVTIPGIAQPFKTDKAFVTDVADRFLAAVKHAGDQSPYRCSVVFVQLAARCELPCLIFWANALEVLKFSICLPAAV